MDAERRDREYCLKQAELFMATLKKMPEGEQIESTELFMALVDKVIVGEGLTFVLRQFRTIRVVGWRVNFPSGAPVNFEGLLEVNQEICIR